tara:strand:- start:30 stop:539 length:510 start_codon:yes stop_codon:yes gene_type:complete
MEVIDEFLDSSQFESLYDFMMGDEIPWYFNSYVDYATGDYRFIDDPDNYQFVHNFYTIGKESHSYLLPTLAPIIEKINCKKLLRVKSNLNPRTSNHIKRNFHIDSDRTWNKHKTSILYINTNNGWTEFEDGSKVNSVSNRMVIFDSPIKHAGITCTDEKSRVLINFNYE